MSGPAPACPVCKARFRMTRQCTRCGADLAPLMALIVKSHLLRSAARQALYAGDTMNGRRLASMAQALLSTPEGSRLVWIARWLEERAGVGSRAPLPGSG
jgi:hypothetical protein